MLNALFPKGKQRVLSLLFGQPSRSFGLMELIKLAGSGSGAVQRELDRLVASGLVSMSVVGTQKRFTANREAALFDELRSIIDKTVGIPGVLRATLETLGTSVRFAVLYGSVAKDTEHATSDVDVLVVSDQVGLEQLFSLFEPIERRLGRRVSPTLYTSDEFHRRRAARQPFLTKVLGGKHVVLVGSEDAAVATR
jgi:predicted nucleotidyltransferase